MLVAPCPEFTFQFSPKEAPSPPRRSNGVLWGCSERAEGGRVRAAAIQRRQLPFLLFLDSGPVWLADSSIDFGNRRVDAAHSRHLGLGLPVQKESASI